MKPPRLDRTAFGMRSHAQTEQQSYAYWSKQSDSDRLAAAAYLTSVAYGYPSGSPPRMDKSVHEARKR
jgi:hypothetical protein